jgi:hypothetical protein
MLQSSTVLPDAFDVDAEKADPGFAPIPPGTYKAEITEATAGPTKSGNGYRVMLRWVFTEGQYKGRHLFQWLNVEHTSEKAQEIGRGQLKSVCVALGITGKLKDLAVLKFIPARIVLRTRKAKGDYPESIEVSEVIKIQTDNSDLNDAIPDFR